MLYYHYAVFPLARALTVFINCRRGEGGIMNELIKMAQQKIRSLESELQKLEMEHLLYGIKKKFLEVQIKQQYIKIKKEENK